MSNISGNFSNAAAGSLRISFSGTYFHGTQRSAGFPSGQSNMLIRANVNGNFTEPIDRYAPMASTEVNYPGGNVLWPVSTEVVASTSGGQIGTWGMQNLRMVLQLLKK